ncbi:MAG: alpha/beta fold hydrolase [Actinobacteria bacterium]|nr:alpha/beta fold hydrolase [Actinomycetota bacterium]
MRRIGVVVAGVLGVLMLVASLVGLIRAQAKRTVRAEVVDGIPVTVYSTNQAAPTVVIAHGFAGSAQIMDPLARGLMRSGFTVVTFDFDGHGRNAAALGIDPAREGSSGDALQASLATVISWAATQPEVDPARVGLLGHSMGAGAVVRYAVDSAPDGLRATVAISLPSADDIPDGQPSSPANLLLLFGALEDDRFSGAASAGLRAAYPDGIVGRPYGDPSAGTARMASSVPGAEHIGILFSGTTLDESIDWLGDALEADTTPGQMAPVLLWAVLALVGGGLLLVPVSAAALGSGSTRPPWTLPGRWAIVLVLVASVGASLVARVAAPLSGLLPLAVGGYLATWFLVAGLTAAVGWIWRWRARAGWPVVTGRAVLGAVLTAAVAVVVLVVPGRMSWAPFSLVGSRVWLAGLMLVVFTVYFAADELVVRRASLPRRIGLVLASRVIAVAVILGSIPLLGAPGFLVLLLPLMALMLLVLAGYAAVVSRFRDGFLAAVLVQAVPLALLVATTFPLTASAS